MLVDIVSLAGRTENLALCSWLHELCRSQITKRPKVLSIKYISHENLAIPSLAFCTTFPRVLVWNWFASLVLLGIHVGHMKSTT
jgi:hypothetical protein